jgi:hypothetical protein
MSRRPRQSRGKFAVGALLCALAVGAHAGERQRFGVRVDTGLGDVSNGFVALGAAADVDVAPFLAVVVDGQAYVTVDTEYSTLTVGLRLRSSQPRGISPYLTVAAGTWHGPQSGGAQAGAPLYAFAGVGASIGISRTLSAFGEVRPTLQMRHSQPLFGGTPVLFGVRVGF